MSNSTVNLIRNAIGSGAILLFDLPVAASTHLFEGTLISQLTSGGACVPYSTASSGVCVGVSQHEADNSSGVDGDRRIRVESKRLYAFPNGTSSDAFADTDRIGSLVYATDDHTVAKTSGTQARAPVGFYYGMETDGAVRVFIDPAAARVVFLLQRLTDSPADPEALRNNLVGAFG